MATRLPYGALAIVDITKIESYCLSPCHPRGRHKARVFQKVLGLRQEDAGWLRDALLAAAERDDATCMSSDAWGDQWRLDTIVTRHGRSGVVRTIWIIRTNEFRPRFVSGWGACQNFCVTEPVAQRSSLTSEPLAV
jgi:hypothetical protein